MVGGRRLGGVGEKGGKRMFWADGKACATALTGGNRHACGKES